MAKTFDDHAADDVKKVLGYLEIRWGKNDTLMAKKLKCSVRTVATLRADPLSCTAVYTERLRRYARLEAKKEAAEEDEERRRYLC
jgi:hypothetical protein